MFGIFAAKKASLSIMKHIFTSSTAIGNQDVFKLNCGFSSTCNCGALIQDVQMTRGSASVRPDDIVNGSREATLGLLWRAFLQFQASWLKSCVKPVSTVWQSLLGAATRHLPWRRNP